jgi:hypothetical protein
MRAALFATACLPVGFAVAEATGIRPLGGIAIVVLATLALRSSPAPITRQGLWCLLVAVCFGISHALADPLGAWPAVAVVTAVTGAAGALLLERRPQTAW